MRSQHQFNGSLQVPPKDHSILNTDSTPTRHGTYEFYQHSSSYMAAKPANVINEDDDDLDRDENAQLM